MPVLHVRARDRSSAQAEALVDALPQAVAEATGIRAERVWVTFTPFSAGKDIAYVDAHLKPRAPFVTEALLEAASHCVATHLELPVADVWARAFVIEPGTVFAGGAIQR